MYETPLHRLGIVSAGLLSEVLVLLNLGRILDLEVPIGYAMPTVIMSALAPSSAAASIHVERGTDIDRLGE